MQDAVTFNIVNKLKNWQLPATGSKLLTYSLSLGTAYADLVATANGKGELVAIGGRGTTTTTDRFLDSVRITCDGGTPVAITGMSGVGGEFYTVSGASGATVWMPVNMPFNVSIYVEALRNAGATGGAYGFALIRWVV